MGRRATPERKRTASAGDDDDDDEEEEEGNEDLTLEIIEKARRRKAKRKKAEDRASAAVPGDVAIVISSASSVEREFASDADPAPSGGRTLALDAKVKRKEKKPRKATKKAKQPEETETTRVSTVEVQSIGTVEFVDNVINEAPDNGVLQKLLRGPRYFDPGETNLSTCFNCGEEGHIFANCTTAKREKPCFLCGLFGHTSRQCAKEQACYACKRSGHRAKDCPDKHKKIVEDTKFCLRCGDLGHDMSSCRNGYPPDDLKEVRCYICKQYGHLCCVNFMETGPGEVFCHNCAESGHIGLGCAKVRGESNRIASSAVCYKCHQEGHFARGCAANTKSRLYFGQSSSSKPSGVYVKTPKFSSMPCNVGKTCQDRIKFEEKRNMATVKSRDSGGHSVHHQKHLHREKFRGNPMASSTTPLKENHIHDSLNYNRSYSKSCSLKNQTPLFRTPSSHVSQKTFKHGSSTSRFGKFCIEPIRT